MFFLNFNNNKNVFTCNVHVNGGKCIQPRLVMDDGDWRCSSCISSVLTVAMSRPNSGVFVSPVPTKPAPELHGTAARGARVRVILHSDQPVTPTDAPLFN